MPKRKLTEQILLVGRSDRQGKCVRAVMFEQSQAEIYYANAIDCVRLAAGSTDSSRKLALLRMSQAWLDLAHVADRSRTTAPVFDAPPISPSADRFQR